MRDFVKKILKNIGYEIRKKPLNDFTNHKRSLHTMDWALMRIKNLGIDPQFVVDVGAASGMWTQKALKYWPDAHYDLIEPLKEQIPHLDNLAFQYPKLKYHTGVAGAQETTVHFSVSNDLDGSGVYGKDAANVRELPVLTIDNITNQQSGPFLIKLDTHGYEVPILEGAKETLKNTNVVIIEVYGFYVSPTALLFHQLSVWLEELGFRLFDIVDVMRRDKDMAFWQADAVYLKTDNAIFKDNAYK